MDKEKSADEHVAQRSQPVNWFCARSSHPDCKAANCKSPKGCDTQYVFHYASQTNAEFDQEKNPAIARAKAFSVMVGVD